MRYGFSDITIYQSDKDIENSDFINRNALISARYIDFLEGYKPKGVTRISVQIDTEDEVRTKFGSILHVAVKFNKEGYLNGTQEKRNLIILDTIHHAAMLGAEKIEWDKNVLELAYNRVLSGGFIYRKETSKKKAQNKQHQASLLVEKNGNSTIISAIFYGMDGQQLKTVKLIETFHNSISFSQLLKNNKWFNDHEFGIHMAKRQIQIKASYNKQNPETVFSPVDIPIEELEGYLRRITYRTFANRFEYVEWANK